MTIPTLGNEGTTQRNPGAQSHPSLQPPVFPKINSKAKKEKRVFRESGQRQGDMLARAPDASKRKVQRRLNFDIPQLNGVSVCAFGPTPAVGGGRGDVE
jgi:hypothetical protein